ncbi:hypothetical protein GCM10010124_05590 [Pilimelia terevasa]|uniref:PIN domain-containing protein n=1 Tax=Pilimelia terevasa TaxID=53372 RepID=A0A8J3BJX2_9ACTN|nr:PIN domain-containing protein [Pilimelia terevasa]GGK15836.1 hypothetical protein GCM10010124_05590 [Pilimelia terevasa]
MNTSAPIPMVFDSSAVLSWLLQECGRWQKVDKLLRSDRIDRVLPTAALTEVIYKAAEAGNTAGPDRIAALMSSYLRLADITTADAQWAGDRIAESRRNPVPAESGGQPHTLSLGDGLVLAVADRLQAPAVTFDDVWGRFPTMKFRLISPYKVP